jgi:hypothetical protein
MLTKDQVAKLSPEHQEALANVEISRALFRQNLLNEMRGLNKPWLTGWKIIASWGFVFVVVYLGLQMIKPSASNIGLATLAVMAVYFVGWSYTETVSRRLNALIKFLEEDGQLDPVSERAADIEKQEPQVK